MRLLPDQPIYEQPPKLSREELEAEFASNDPERILRALIAASYTEPPEWVQEQCFKFAAHAGEPARRGAAIVLGSIAFVHGPINFERAVATLEELRREDGLKIHADDSLMLVLNAARNRTQ